MKISRPLLENATLSVVALLIGGSMIIGVNGRGPSDFPETHNDVEDAIVSPPVVGSRERSDAGDFKSPTTLERQIYLVKEGDTLINILLSAGLGASEAVRVSNAAEREYDPKKFRPGHKLVIDLVDLETANENRTLVGLEFMAERDTKVVLARRIDGLFSAATVAVSHSQELVIKTGSVGTSFFDSARAVVVPVAVIQQSFSALSHVVDFQRELQKGDTFEMVYSEFDDESPFGRHAGQLHSISLVQRHRSLQFWRYTTTDGYSDYFDESGASVSRSLMKTPVDGARLSSHYGSRKHPILGYSRMHRGLDFAAPEGTPIFAAGDGVIELRQPNGSYGNYIEITHDTGFSSAYGHLESFAEEIAPGRRVRQAQVIGFVGSTGLATGPNLHFEIRRDGRQVNPLRVNMPPRRTLSGTELARFRSSISEWRAGSKNFSSENIREAK